MTRIGLMVLAVTIAAAGGCKKPTPSKPAPAAGGGPPAAGPAPAGGGKPDRWSDDQVKSVVKDSLHLTDVTLTRAGEEGIFTKYTGTGRDAAGAAYTMTVKYRAGEIVIDYEETANGRTQTKRYEWRAEGVEPGK